MKRLYNKVNREVLKQQLQESTEARTTLSFYRYLSIAEPQSFRDDLFLLFSELGVMGRIYIAKEGINGQISVPDSEFELFKTKLYSVAGLQDMRLNIAIEDDGKSFFKLKIKVREKIVADGLNDETFDVRERGQHINAKEFNDLAKDPNTIIVDMRNHYETEVGHFEKAICPDVETFREALPLVEKILEEDKDKNIVMYCTGGIRCEKASAYYKHKGFQKVYQLDGGIIEYARQVEAQQLENKFIGKNFVFDERMGERISDAVIAHCHQCGKSCDTHINCANDACHILFIQCASCADKYQKTCSDKCHDFMQLPEEERLEVRKTAVFNGTKFGKGRYKAHNKENGKIE